MTNPACRGDIEDRVLNVVKEVLAVDDEKISLDATIADQLAASSLDQVSLVMALEDEFGATILEEDAHQINTIQSIVDYIECRLQTA